MGVAAADLAAETVSIVAPAPRRKLRRFTFRGTRELYNLTCALPRYAFRDSDRIRISQLAAGGRAERNMDRARRKASGKLERRAESGIAFAATPLPNGGQSGIAVWGNRLFLATFEPYKPGAPKTSATILGHSIDANTGKILWSVRLEGSVPSPMIYAYSDSTSPSPVTDGKYVWFFNASGEMGCWDFNGKEVWRRQYKPWGEPYPFNKQHEPILYGGYDSRPE